MKHYFLKALLFVIICSIFSGVIFLLGLLFSDESSLLEEQYIEQSVYDSAENEIDTNDALILAQKIVSETSQEEPTKIPDTPLITPEVEPIKQVIPKKTSIPQIDFSFIPASFAQSWFDESQDIKSTLDSQTLIEYIESITVALYEERPDVRGRMKNKTVKLFGPQNMNEAEMLGVFIHELAHYIDLYFFKRDNGDDISNAFYNHSWYSTIVVLPGQQQKDFVSGYAMTNKYEDFAESLTYYMFHNSDFKEKTQESDILMKKYDFFSQHLFKNKEFMYTDFSLGNNVEKYYRDITKINFSKKNFLQYLKNSI